MSEIVKAMTLLQLTMQQPWCKDLMMKLGFVPPVHHDQALQEARDGKPSSSRPSPTPVPTPVPAPAAHVPAPAPAGGDPGATPPEKEPADKADDPPVPATINSNTHRAAHARLARRMASLGEAECPNMTKLWGGSRKDCCCSHVHRWGWGGVGTVFFQKIQF